MKTIYEMTAEERSRLAMERLREATDLLRELMEIQKGFTTVNWRKKDEWNAKARKFLDRES